MTSRSNMVRIGLLVLFCLALAVSGCLRTAPIYNVNNAPVPTGMDLNKKLTMEEINAAILVAGAGLGWKMRTEKPGLVEAQLDLRSHQAIVLIDYDVDKYDITYKSSINLKEGNGKIHSNYNGWVQNLNNAIGRELSSTLARK